MSHKCPLFCHRCPELAGDVLPMCYGSVHRNDLKGCTCEIEARCAREAARRLAEMRHVPKQLATDLDRFARSRVPRMGGRP